MRKARSGWRGLAALLVAASLETACLHQPGTSASPDIADDSTSGVPIQIANHNWSDVIIYVLRDGQPSRLGIATAASSASFLLPRRMLGQGGEIQLWGRPIGARGAAFSEVVVVQPGQWIEWTLESDLDRSAIGVY
jgi:hypothetical protein